ncbi:DsbC family protein [Azohydromonas lata]|uniref:DsbC family protein n=1 Tax=Azohydromonas lata TaxID=45677 RepID=UPI00082CEDFA|nr:DsbC family protein [Azohydromonas lata]
MPVTDTIRPFGRSLYVEFGSTGDSGGVSTLALDKGLTLRKNGLEVHGQYHTSDAGFVIERFASEQLATNGLQLLRGAVQQYARRQRIVGTLKSAVLWGVAPAAAVVTALALNVAATRQAGVLPPMAAGQPLPAPAQLAAAPGLPGTPMQPPEADVAKGMENAAQAGRFSVKVSTGSAGKLYVFSDPSCPHCRDFERELDVLAKTYTVEVFPVSVIGGTSSSGRVAQLLCTDAKARAAGWKKLVAGGTVEGAPACEEGPRAVAANDQIFRVLSLPGTPAIVAADGRIMPENMPLNAQSVDSWMRAALRR